MKAKLQLYNKCRRGKKGQTGCEKSKFRHTAGRGKIIISLVKGTVPRDFLVHVSFHQSAPSWSLINRCLAFFIWLHIRRDIDPLIVFCVVSHNADKNKILLLSLFEKWILYTFIRDTGTVMYVYFEQTVPLKVYSEVLLFKY